MDFHGFGSPPARLPFKKVLFSTLFRGAIVLALILGPRFAESAPSRLATYTQGAEMSAADAEALNVDLFLLALGHQGLAGGKSGICVDYVGGENPRFRVAVDTDRAFLTGRSELHQLEGGFDSGQLSKLLAYFHEYRTASGQAKASSPLNVQITGYADPQHYENAKSVEESIRMNRDLSHARAKTIESVLKKNPGIGGILRTSTDGVPSASLERKYPRSNSDYAANGGENRLKCDPRRKVVLSADLAAVGVGENAKGSYSPPHRLADPQLRLAVASHLNRRFKAALDKTSADLPREARAVAAAEALVSDARVPSICREEPIVSMIALQVLGVQTEIEKSKNRVDERLARDNLRTEGLGLQVRGKDWFFAPSSDDYSLHRNLLAFRLAAQSSLRKSLGRDPRPEELQKHLSSAVATKGLVASLQDPKNRELRDEVAQSLEKITSGTGTPKGKALWSIGGGTAAFQCFGIEGPLKDHLKTAQGRSESLKSGADLIGESTREVTISIDPAKMHEVKVSDQPLLQKTGTRPILACKYCGMGLHSDAKSGKLEFYDRSLGSKGQSVVSNLRAYSERPSDLSWGALMSPVSYVIPNCRNCDCGDVMDRIESCEGNGDGQGVARCKNGVIKLNPVVSSTQKAELKLSRADAEASCIYTPPSFHSCGVGPEGVGAEAQAKTTPTFDYFDPVMKKYSAKEAGSIDDLLKILSRDWAASCAQPGTSQPDTRLPQEVIDDVMCRDRPNGGFPTGIDEKDCPELAGK